MTNLTNFLLAQLAADEAAALAAISSQADPENGWGYGGYGSPNALAPHVGIIHEAVQAEHIVRWHPARVLAEVKAKRAIVAMHYVGDPDDWAPEQWACRLCQWDEDCDSPKHDHQHGAGRFPCDTLRALAQPYRDQPGWQEAWAL